MPWPPCLVPLPGLISGFLPSCGLPETRNSTASCLVLQRPLQALANMQRGMFSEAVEETRKTRHVRPCRHVRSSGTAQDLQRALAAAPNDPDVLVDRAKFVPCLTFSECDWSGPGQHVLLHDSLGEEGRQRQCHEGQNHPAATRLRTNSSSTSPSWSRRVHDGNTRCRDQVTSRAHREGMKAPLGAQWCAGCAEQRLCP